MTTTVSVFEMLWLAVVIFGAGVSGVGAFDAHADVRKVTEADLGGGKLVVVRQHRFEEVVSLAICIVFAYVGFLAAQTPQGDTPVLNLAALLFMGVAVLLVYASFRRRATRHALLGIGIRKRLESAPMPVPRSESLEID